MDQSPDERPGADEAHRTIVTDGGGESPDPPPDEDGVSDQESTDADDAASDQENTDADDAASDQESVDDDGDAPDSTTQSDVQEVREQVEATGGNVGFESASGDWVGGDEESELEQSSVSRRRVFGYVGGTMAGVFGFAGASWYAFFRNTNEPEEQVVIDYWDYIDRAKYNSAVAILHRNAPVEPIAPETVAVYSQASIDVGSTEILDRREDVELPGVLTLALVRAEISLDWGTSTDRMNPAFAVAENEENNWRIWDDGRNNDNRY